LTPGTLKERVCRSVVRRGVMGTAAVMARYVAIRLSRAVILVRERWFDARYGVDTSGRVPPHDLGTYGDAKRYQGTLPHLFHEIIRRLNIQPRLFTFVDVGCGKGRVVVLAAQIGFRRVVGIDVSPGLVEVARKNLQVRGLEASVEVLDATDLSFPTEPFVLYLFNPFGEATLRTLAARLRHSLQATPRPAILVYVYPVHREVLVSEEFDVIAGGAGWLAFRSRLTPESDLEGTPNRIRIRPVGRRRLARVRSAQRALRKLAGGRMLRRGAAAPLAGNRPWRMAA
jgi:SAM-dependent methyltransferase